MATDTANLPTGNAPLEAISTKQISAIVPASATPDLAEDSAITTSPTLNSGSDDLKKDGDCSKSGKVSSAGSANFADVSDTDKKIRRAERFGLTVQLSEEEKRNSRAERFGTGSGSTNKSEELKRKARAERFGLPATAATADEDAKKKARLQRFAPASKTDPLEEEKKKARELRFSQPQSNSLSMNGKGDIEQKAAIAGKAAGGT